MRVPISYRRHLASAEHRLGFVRASSRIRPEPSSRIRPGAVVADSSRVSTSLLCSPFGVCVKTVRKWIERYRAEGAAGLVDRSSRPRRLHRLTPAAVVAEVEHLRRQRYTGNQIAAELGISPATVSRHPSAASVYPRTTC